MDVFIAIGLMIGVPTLIGFGLGYLIGSCKADEKVARLEQANRRVFEAHTSTGSRLRITSETLDAIEAAIADAREQLRERDEGKPELVTAGPGDRVGLMKDLVQVRMVTALLLCCLTGSVESAATVAIQAEAQQCDGNSCRPPTRAWGTGVAIGRLSDGRSAVLTAGHVVRNATSVSVCVAPGRWQPAAVLAAEVNNDVDLAVLAVDFQQSWICGRLAPRHYNGPAKYCGYVPDRGWSCRPCDIDTKAGRCYGTRSIPGESGAPLVIDHVVHGISWGGDGQDSWFTSSVTARAWLEQRIGHVPSCDAPVARGPPSSVPPLPPAVEVPRCNCVDRSLEIAALRRELETLRVPIKVQIRRDGELIDEDTIDVFRGQPIVLDFQRKSKP